MTTRFNSLAACWAVALGVAAGFSLGCGTGSSPRASVNEVSPEDSFQIIVDTFRRGIETSADGGGGGFIVPEEGGGHSRLSVNNTVVDELFPPQEDGETYRATITVVQRASYALLRESADDTSRGDRSSRDSRRPAETVPGDSAGIEVIDSDLVSLPQPSPKSSRGPVDESLIARHSDEETRTIDLIYQDGHWDLHPNTEFDEATEQSIKYAIEVALGTQR